MEFVQRNYHITVNEAWHPFIDDRRTQRHDLHRPFTSQQGLQKYKYERKEARLQSSHDLFQNV